MRARPVSLLLSLIGLGLLLAASVSAQGPRPPVRPPRALPHPSPMPTSDPVTGRPLSPRLPSAAVQSVQATVALGQPGLSFRYVQTFGVTEEPYPTDAAHLNGPNGLFVDAADSLYVVEEAGQRLLRFNDAGSNDLVVGHAGQPWHHDDYLSWPKDVAVDSSGHIWVVMAPAVKEFDSSGSLVQIFPEQNPWESGDANDRFADPRGIAFDSAGRLYVSDHGNHRVQVYDVSGGTPVYSTTIGVTGVPTSTDTGFDEPSQIAFDSLDRLYVVDTANYRVQRCTFSAGAWTCSTFFGESGVPGDDLTHMGWSYGLSLDPSDNVFIADGGNVRALKCDASGSCTVFAGVSGEPGSDNAHFRWPADIAVDSQGNAYVSDGDNHRIQKYDGSGEYLGTIGVSGVPYVADNTRINSPWGIAVAADSSVYVTENRGYRLLKFDASGAQQWAAGQAGVYASDDHDNARLGSLWTGMEGNVAVDASGRIYVPDTGNNRVQILNPDGTYFATFGSVGNGNYQFECPAGVAISPVNGDVYVVDHCNQRIQVYTSNRVYKATLGVLDQVGDDNAHFAWPWGVALDAAGNIYVADPENYRVQKCNLSGTSYSCATFAGETGVFGDDFGHMFPIAVAVDGAGRVYAVDHWNARVQVYDSSGAYLATLGGSWGSNSGKMRGPVGVGFDRAGNVYVAERDNHRIQKFAPGVPGWRQVNINGFGDRDSIAVGAVEVYGGQLYAGALSWQNGSRVWRNADGVSWTAVSEPGFGSANVEGSPAIIDMIEFGGQLYACTGWGSQPGQIWRSPDGTQWNQVVGDGFGNAENTAITAFGVFGGQLYAAAGNWSGEGLEIWRSGTGDSGDWTSVVLGGLGSGSNRQVCGLAVFGGQLYASIENLNEGMEMWRTADGSAWAQVRTGGFGDPGNIETGGLQVFGGYLYVGTRNDSTGAQLWRSAEGTSWVQVTGDGFGDSNNRKLDSLVAFRGQLYAGVGNEVTGMEIWRSPDGVTWSQVNPDGFGDSNTWTTLWSNATVAHNGGLYVGTWNGANGGEVWLYLSERVYLPLALRG